MTGQNKAQADEDMRNRETRKYVIGLISALCLTFLSFGLVWLKVMAPGTTLLFIAALALAQIVVHFYFFLHIDLKKSHRDDLHLVLFTSLIVALMVGGSLWILIDLHNRML